MYSTYVKSEIERRLNKTFDETTYTEKESVCSQLYREHKEKIEKFEKTNNIDYDLQRETKFNFWSDIKHTKEIQFNVNENEYLKTDILIQVGYNSKYKPRIEKTICKYCKKEFGTSSKSLGHFSRHLNKKHDKILFGLEIQRELREIVPKNKEDW